MRKRTNKVWSLSVGELRTVTRDSRSLLQVLKRFGLPDKGYYYRSLRKRLAEENIDFSHFATGIGATKGMKFQEGPNRFALEQVLVEQSDYSRTSLRRRLIAEGLLPEVCGGCGIGPTWNGRPLSLQIDHINGINDDNRLVNLRLMCPNCHSQTETFAGRKLYRGGPASRMTAACVDCGVAIHQSAARCQPCQVIKRRIVPRMTHEELATALETRSALSVAREVGVSDVTIAKWARQYGIKRS